MNRVSLMDQYQIFNTLGYLLLWSCIVWYARYHWKRRHLYRAAWKRPGPFPLPFIGNALYFAGSAEAAFRNFLSLTRSYKSPMPLWIGSKLLFVVYEAKDLEIIMNSPHALEKDELYKFGEPFVGTGLLTAPVSKWKRHRKVIMPTMNQKTLNNFMPIFVKQSQVLLEQLQRAVGKGEFDVFDYVSRCSLDMICETTMGTTVQAQTTDSDYVKWSEKTMDISFRRMINIWYHSDFIFNLTSYSKELKDNIRKMHDFTRSVVRQKREDHHIECLKRKTPFQDFTDEEPNMRSFLEHLIRLSEGGTNFTDEEVREEVDTFMIAGSDTSASITSFTFVALGMHPDIQERVYREVLDVLGPDRPVEHTDLNNFPYMERVLRETMRIFPVAPIILRAITQEINLEKCTIPAGCSVLILIIATHLDSSVYPKPFKFDPDRFLPEEVAKRHSYSWVPFSGGPRNCAGIKYALMTMKTIIATVIRKYKFSSGYKEIRDIPLKPQLVLKPIDGYNVSIELRS